ncbi:MAG: dTDP-4-dehydrorhamnose 3,5-epimerase [Candidatus Gastranaerophilales bacterium]|nr:dTDP-4-dehydrorhamnose 3,5-epimerase [Candidatus Gastranaerophilales bacterium]
MPFEFVNTELEGVILIKPKVFGDERGFFLESYKKSDFQKAGINAEFNQDNHSKSTKGVLRGLHFQENPYAQAKLVRCIRGNVFDVAVDIRKGSADYLKWVGFELSEENKSMLFIPEGFAHGFLVLSDEAELAYKASNEFNLESDGGIRWDDPDINITWGIDFDPVVSQKDAALPFAKDSIHNFKYKE